MRRWIWLVLVGCTAPSYAYVDVGDPDAVAAPVFGTCFDDANTLVVGPDPGCVSLSLDHSELDVNVCPILGGVGAPVRVIRRGSLPLRISVDRPNSWDASTRRPGVYRPSPGEEGGCCEGLDEAEAFEDRNEVGPLPLAEGLDTVELLVVPGRRTYQIEICTLALSETRTTYLTACRDACEVDVECGFSPSRPDCLARCDQTVAQQTELCLSVLMEAMPCEAERRCEHALADDEVLDEENCPGYVRRTDYECLFATSD